MELKPGVVPVPQSVTLRLTEGQRTTTGTVLTTTNETAVYTAQSDNPVEIAYINISNVDASNACTVRVRWFDARANASYTLYPTKSLAAATVLSLPNNEIRWEKLRLEEGDEIRVTAQNANDLEVVVGAIEHPGNM